MRLIVVLVIFFGCISINAMEFDTLSASNLESTKKIEQKDKEDVLAIKFTAIPIGFDGEYALNSNFSTNLSFYTVGQYLVGDFYQYDAFYYRTKISLRYYPNFLRKNRYHSKGFKGAFLALNAKILYYNPIELTDLEITSTIGYQFTAFNHFFAMLELGLGYLLDGYSDGANIESCGKLAFGYYYSFDK